MTKPKGPGANMPESEINPEESNPTQPAMEVKKAQSSTSNILTGTEQTIPQPSDKDAVDKFAEFNAFNLETTEESSPVTPETPKTSEPKIGTTKSDSDLGVDSKKSVGVSSESHEKDEISKIKDDHKDKMKKYKIKREKYEERIKAYQNELNQYLTNNLSIEDKNKIAQLNAERDQLVALQTKNEPSAEIYTRLKEVNEKRQQFFDRHIPAQFKVKKKQLMADVQALVAKGKQLKAEDEQLGLASPVFTASRTFLNQASSQPASVVTQRGISLKDITDYLSKNTNVMSLNKDAKRKFINVDKSIQSATSNEIKLELSGPNNEKTNVSIKRESNGSENETLSYHVNKEAKDDLESLKSVCRLAVLSAANKNKLTEFNVNENHPHSDKIKDYLSTAIQELTPEKASKFKVNGTLANQKPQDRLSAKSQR